MHKTQGPCNAPTFPALPSSPCRQACSTPTFSRRSSSRRTPRSSRRRPPISPPITDAIFDHAADLWVAAHALGRPQKDGDLLIAATALEHGRVLVTGNTADFSWIRGLTLEDWRQP